jgi:hypothetical protein
MPLPVANSTPHNCENTKTDVSHMILPSQTDRLLSRGGVASTLTERQTADVESGINDPVELVQVAFAVFRRANAAGGLTKLRAAFAAAQCDVDAAETESAGTERTLRLAKDLISAGGPTDAQIKRAKDENDAVLTHFKETGLGLPVILGVSATRETTSQTAYTQQVSGTSALWSPSGIASSCARQGRCSSVPGRTPLAPTQHGAPGNALIQKASSGMYTRKLVDGNLLKRLSSMSITGSSYHRSDTRDSEVSSRWPSSSRLEGLTQVQLGKETSLLGYRVLHGLIINANETLAELSFEAGRVRRVLAEKLMTRIVAESALETRRVLNARLLTVLDRFYGRLPGWEDDPVSQALIGDLGSMSDSGVEVERDMWEQQSRLLNTQLVLLDHNKCSEYLSVCLLLLKNVDETLVRAEAANVIDILRHGPDAYTAASVVQSKLMSARSSVNEAVLKAKIASLCCPNMARAPHILDTTKRLQTIIQTDINFHMMGSDVITGRLIVDALALTSSASYNVQCGLQWVTGRVASIKCDQERADTEIEMLESDVLEERIVLLRQHHAENKHYDLDELERQGVE